MLSVNDDGIGSLIYRDPVASIVGDPEADEYIVGLPIVIHNGQDDLGLGTGDDEAGSLANGNAGARVACCIDRYSSSPPRPTL